MERTKRKSSVYNDYVPYGGRVPNFKEKEGMKLKKEQFDVTGMTYLLHCCWMGYCMESNHEHSSWTGIR